MKPKVIAELYLIALAIIVLLANRGDSAHLFEPVRRLPLGDKIGHFLLTGGFSFVANLALRARTIHIGNTPVLLGSLLVMAVVFCEETSQIFIPIRTFDWLDLAADATGIFCFGALARWMLGRKKRPSAVSATQPYS